MANSMVWCSDLQETRDSKIDLLTWSIFNLKLQEVLQQLLNSDKEETGVQY